MRIGDYKDKAKEVLERYSRIPTLKEPNGAEEINFPSNADGLSGEELDSWLILLGGWRGWVSAQAADIETQLILLEEALTLRLGIWTASLEKDSKKKLLKESLHGMAINQDKELAELKLEVTTLQAERRLLQNKFEFFDKLFETVSRVVSRQASERNRA